MAAWIWVLWFEVATPGAMGAASGFTGPRGELQTPVTYRRPLFRAAAYSWLGKQPVVLPLLSTKPVSSVEARVMGAPTSPLPALK